MVQRFPGNSVLAIVPFYVKKRFRSVLMVSILFHDNCLVKRRYVFKEQLALLVGD